MPPRINVAYVIDALEEPLGGTEKQLLETIRRMDDSRFNVHLVCLRQTPFLEKNILPCQVTVLNYGGFFSMRFIKVLKKLRAFIENERISVVQTFFEDSFFVAYFSTLGYGGRLVRLASRRDVGMGPHHLWYHVLYDWVRPLLIRSFDGVIANARQVAEFISLKDGIDPRKIKVIYNGADLAPETVEPVPDLFRNEKADVWIAHVANLKRIKRHDVFLKALVLARQSCPELNVKAVFLGDGQERAEIEGLIDDLGLGKVVFLMGTVTNVRAILKYVQIGVLTSDKEGLSNAILDYMSCGLPVVASDVGGNKELVDESFGFRFPAGQHMAMSQALCRLLKDPHLRRRMGQGAFRKVKTDFSWDKHMNELQGYYESLCLKK